MHNRFKVEFFGGEQGKPFAQRKAHLITKHRARTRAGAVSFYGAMLLHMAHEVEIGVH